uniref:GmrSD restriction endonucleases N-terminal domain-containing protein n=1 Tax=Candidatus Methanogaster sp. ANME-2c ERB4 TaxID=2759911 RepID=A0A7G9YI23_9EURY|nr:hypothetical protein MPIGPLOG_00025 [Methanosarcinales archaeon ANME-2c ERB4]
MDGNYENSLEIEDETDTDEDYSLTEYDITTFPSDFNIKTIFDFMESEIFKVPGFQRNYVWDLTRASKLIESIILGIPVPQIFLYEKSKNEFLVVDGQQRLMTIYYFMKMRFPKKEKRYELRIIFDEMGRIPDDILHNDDYFSNFKLRLPEKLPDNKNKLNKLNYETLGEYKNTFEMRTIRNIIIKQNSPPDDDSVIYEIFNRLNTGGMNLTPQEIRTSLYHSDFYDMLYRINLDARWRKLIGIPEPELHMKDVEMLLRGFAMLVGGDNYKPSMVKFLNKFSNDARSFSEQKVEHLENLFDSFLNSCQNLNERAFIGRTNRINISIYEAVFTAVCGASYDEMSLNVPPITKEQLNALKNDEDVKNATISKTASKTNVETRLRRAREILAI